MDGGVEIRVVGTVEGNVESEESVWVVKYFVICEFVSQNIFIHWFEKVNSPTKSLSYCFLLLIRISSGRFCGGVDFLKLIDKHLCHISRKVDIRLPGRGNSNSRGARPVYSFR